MRPTQRALAVTATGLLLTPLAATRTEVLVDCSFSDGARRALLVQRSQDVVSACNPG